MSKKIALTIVLIIGIFSKCLADFRIKLLNSGSKKVYVIESNVFIYGPDAHDTIAYECQKTWDSMNHSKSYEDFEIRFSVKFKFVGVKENRQMFQKIKENANSPFKKNVNDWRDAFRVLLKYQDLKDANIDFTEGDNTLFFNSETDFGPNTVAGKAIRGSYLSVIGLNTRDIKHTVRIPLHEFGHLLGFGEAYDKDKGVFKGYEHDLMSNDTNSTTKLVLVAEQFDKVRRFIIKNYSNDIPEKSFTGIDFEQY